MNSLARKFFAKNETFREVISPAEMSWEEAVQKAPELPRGWYELSRVSPQDRIEFVRDLWLDRMPYHPSAHPAFFQFFDSLDDVAVVLTQRKDGEPYLPEMVYSLADESTFFRGKPPAREETLVELTKEVGVLPRDYLSFLRMHDGFGMLSEMGLLEAGDVFATKRRVMDMLLRADKRVAEPDALIPFYEILGLSSFQCFFSDWYPGSEMGNVYLSGVDYTLSDVTEKKNWSETHAFPTFSEWLSRYLQGMNLCI